jgi:hypothetical protein
MKYLKARVFQSPQYHYPHVNSAETLVPELCAFDIEEAIEELKGTNHQVLIKFQ